MSRTIRFDPDSGRYLDRVTVNPEAAPPPGWVEAQMARIEALPVALRVHLGPGYIICPKCATDPETSESETYEIEEDGTFGVRSCDWCGEEVRAK
jgi:hypothetical protein